MTHRGILMAAAFVVGVEGGVVMFIGWSKWHNEHTPHTPSAIASEPMPPETGVYRRWDLGGPVESAMDASGKPPPSDEAGNVCPPGYSLVPMQP